MPTFYAYLIGYAPLAAYYLAAALIPLIFITAGIIKPSWSSLCVVILILFFSQSGYGSLTIDRNIYTRGTGQMFFSFVTIWLWLLLPLTWISNSFNNHKSIKTNISTPAILIIIVFVGNIFVALALEIKMKFALSANGFINIIHACIFGSLLLRTITSKKDLKDLEYLIIIAGATRGIFGLVRWAAFGGDPANIYENVEKIDIKLTFFEINDSMIAGAVAFYAIRKMLLLWKELSISEKSIWSLIALIELATVTLSYRRTAWSGLALMTIFLIFILPTKQRGKIMLSLPFLAIPVLAIAAQRLTAATKGTGRSFIELFFYDIRSRSVFETESTRTLELKLAIDTILDNPIFGTGSWGRYEGARAIAWQHGEEAYSFIHSGILHLMLKTGFAGLFIFIIMLWNFIYFVRKNRPLLNERDKIFFDSSLAALIFIIPDLLIGTPIIQFRTMLLYALFAAIPYIIIHNNNNKI